MRESRIEKWQKRDSVKTERGRRVFGERKERGRREDGERAERTEKERSRMEKR